LAQNGSHRYNRNRNGYPNTNYGPPDPSEFYDYARPKNNTLSSTTEPYFRIVLSKKTNSNSTNTTVKNRASNTTKEETTEYYFNDVYNDDYYNETDFYQRQNYTLFQNLTATEFRKLFYPDKNNVTIKTNFETTTIRQDKNVAVSTSTLKPIFSNPIRNKNQTKFSPLATLPSTISTTPTTSSPSIATKVAFQFKFATTIPPPTTSKNKSRFVTEYVTESQIDSQSQSEAAFLQAHPSRLSSSEVVTESYNQDLRYLPLPSDSLKSVPEPKYNITNFNLKNSPTNLSIPSRLYLPPN
jgi:hypothetical protein